MTVSRPLVGARQQVVAGGLAQHVEALGIGGAGIDEEQVLADGAREQLRVLGDEADARAQAVEVDRRCPARRCTESRPSRG